MAAGDKSALAAPVPQRGVIGRLRDALEAERDHWFVFQPVLFGLGVGLYFSWPTEPLLWLLCAALALAGLAYAGARGALAIATGIALTIAAGATAAKLRTEWVRAPVLEKRMGAVEVTGYVVLVEPMAKRGQRLTVHVTSIAGVAQHKVPRRVRIRAMVALAGLKPGDGVRLRASLAPPAGPALPAGYDFARTAWYLGLGAVGYSLTAPQRDAAAPPPPWRLRASAGIEKVRQAIGARITAALPGETGAIANALITGERGGISEATNDAFRDAGLYHILSISGLHIAIMAGTVFFSVRLLLACFPAVALRYPIRKWAAAAAALAALGYLLISGSAFATVRSYIMISIMFLAVLIDRPALAMRNVAFAALVILLLFPESLLDVGFQMSFAAVVALIAAYEYVNASSRYAAPWRHSAAGRTALFFAGIVLSTIVAGIAVAPFAAYHFHTSQQFAVLANLITIPVCNLIVMPAALAALLLMPFGLEAPALAVMGAGIETMTWCAKWTAAMPGAVAHLRAIPLAAFLLMVAGGLWLTLWRTRARFAGIAAFAAGLALAPILPRPDALVGRDGALVAIRDERNGRYTALATRSANFELKRWLEHDGDPREPRQALFRAKDPGGMRCDGVGCNIPLKQRTLAVVRHPSAIDDDCVRADILVLDIPRPRRCDRPGTVIDFHDLRRLGTHAVYLEGNTGVRIETVAQYRGNRPWSPAPPLSQPRVTASLPRAQPPAAAAPEPELRPETEGDDDPRFEQE